MNIYIKETEKKDLLSKIKSILNIFKISYNNNRVICEIPCSKKNYNSIVKKIIKSFNRDKVNAAVLSKSLINNENIKKELQANNIKIINGKIIKNTMTIDILKRISTLMNKQIQLFEVSMLANDKTDFLCKNICLIASKVKMLNIITNNINNFKNLENILSDNGILIRVTNNKRKSLLKSDVVINMDFPEELINKYTYKNDSIFININNNAIINKKSFTGINITDINIKIQNNNELEEFDNLLVYESIYYNKGFNTIIEKIEKDKLEIENFIGINGLINEGEFIKN